MTAEAGAEALAGPVEILAEVHLALAMTAKALGVPAAATVTWKMIAQEGICLAATGHALVQIVLILGQGHPGRDHVMAILWRLWQSSTVNLLGRKSTIVDLLPAVSGMLERRAGLPLHPLHQREEKMKDADTVTRALDQDDVTVAAVVVHGVATIAPDADALTVANELDHGWTP